MFQREKDPEWNGAAHDGEDFRYKITRGKEGVVDSVTVAIELPGAMRCALRPEGEFDPLVKRLEISREHQTDDQRFDRRVYVDCENPALNAALSSNPKLRKAIYSLLPAGTGRSLRAANGWLWMSSPEGGVNKDVSDEVIAIDALRAWQPALGNVRDELKPIAARVGEVDSTRRGREVLMTVNVALLALGGLGLVRYSWGAELQLINQAVPFIAALVTIGVVGALLGATLLWLRGTPRSHKLVLDVLLGAFPATCVAALGAALHFNQAQEASEMRRITLPLVRAWEEPPKERPDYFIAVRGWPDERVDPKRAVFHSEYAMTQGRKCIDVYYYDGRLGDPWIEGFAANDTDACQIKVE